LLKKINLLQAYVFALPFFGLDFNIGIRLTISQIILILINIQLIVQFVTSGNFNKLNINNNYFVIFIAYSVIITLFLSLFITQDVQSKFEGFFRTNGRFITQIIKWLLEFSVFYISIYYLKYKTDINKLIKVYLFGVFVIAILGIFQQVIYVSTGSDIFPLIRENNELRIAKEYDYFGLSMIRICSLGGEPRDLAMGLVVGFLLLQLVNNLKIFKLSYYSIFSIIILVAIIFTISSSALITLPILYLLKEILLFLYTKRPLSYSSILFAFVLISVIFLFSNSFSKIYEERVADREMLEDWDQPVVDFLSDNPKWIIFGSGLGNIHKLAYSHVNTDDFPYMENNIFESRIGYLYLISELGIIGFLLFCIAIIHTFYLSNTIFKVTKSHLLLLFVIISIVIFAGYMVRYFLFSSLILFLSVTNTIRINRIEIDPHSNSNNE